MGLRTGLAVILCAALPGVSGAAEFERTFTFQGDQLTVSSLVGSMRVEKAAGNEARVVVSVRGADADPKWITFDESKGGGATLAIRFPVKEHRKYVYPKLGSGSRSTFTMNESRHGNEDWLEQLLDLSSGDRIEVRGRSFANAIELWTDVVVQVPAGGHTRVLLGMGNVDANDVPSKLELRTKCGTVTAHGIEGDLLADTGSGRVEVSHVRGELSVDTGSGSVDVDDVTGGRDVGVDTGSGSVDVRRIKTEKLSIDTGSGGVDLSDIDVKDLAVDTGSGSVDCENVAADAVKIDTGSGGVTLDLVHMGGGRYDVETGSGGIHLDLPQDLSAVFDVEAGSGGIDADINGVTLDRRHHGEAHFEVGGGDARVTLSTGSGGIRLSQGRGSASRH